MKHLIGLMLLAFLVSYGVAPAQNSILEAVQMNENLTTFRTVLELSEGMKELLVSENGYTLLAPENDAFVIFSDAALASLFEETDVATAFIENHILESTLTLAILFAMLSERDDPIELKTVGGNEVSFALSGEESIIINGITSITEVGEVTGTGVLHVIDTILPFDVEKPDGDDDDDDDDDGDS